MWDWLTSPEGKQSEDWHEAIWTQADDGSALAVRMMTLGLIAKKAEEAVNLPDESRLRLSTDEQRAWLDEFLSGFDDDAARSGHQVEMSRPSLEMAEVVLTRKPLFGKARTERLRVVVSDWGEVQVATLP